ncbi:MAG: DUF1016 N-terminal domain-containing protein [Methanomassiliicoccaceae archaeon]|jgi:hypothetical protein|nr:DUF1016 N-terminal domain-containing protein [Methanomassiliicoccaceae archaeon]
MNRSTGELREKARKDNNTKDAAVITEPINDTELYERASTIIKEQRCRAGSFANREITLMFWKLGRLINSAVLGNERAEYGKRIVSALSAQLSADYGNGFSKQDLYRMMLFAEQFTDNKIVSEPARKLSWSHFGELFSSQRSAEADRPLLRI